MTKNNPNQPVAAVKFSPSSTAVWQNILFHFLRHHKEELAAFRAWFVARNVLDAKGSGTVTLDELSTACGMGKKYLQRICESSELFIRDKSGRIRYRSAKTVARWHKLNPYKAKIRREKLTKKFAKQFRSKAGMEGYILKCYVEDDLDPKHKHRFTRGRISYEMVAEHFGISKKTAYNLIKASTAKFDHNIRDMPNYTFGSKAEFESWRFHNMDKVINGHRVEENPFSYRIRKRNDGTYVLCQQLPNVYKFTGLSLARARAIRVNRFPH